MTMSGGGPHPLTPALQGGGSTEDKDKWLNKEIRQEKISAQAVHPTCN